jgi:phosphoribosylamine--glycine ligase
MPPAQDHKTIHDDDQGPNTGGMGACSPAPLVTPTLQATVMDTIMLPTVRAMAAEGRPFRGFLYAGLMIREGVPRVLEFNARFGDPEAQVLLMRLETDLLEILEASLHGRLQEVSLRWRREAAVCVVMASAGYPGPYEKGRPISGLAEAERLPDVTVFHAGTARQGDRVVTAGGRVLGVTALGPDIPAAIRRAYEAVERIHWDGHQYRRDIGRKALTGAEAATLEAG